MSDKKFKDTKLGSFLMEKVPDLVGVIGNVLPDKGVLGIAKNIIDSNRLDPVDQVRAKELLLEEEQLYMQDRANARSREVELAKAGKMDWMMKVVGLVVLALLCFTVVSIFFFELKNENMAHLVLGEILGLSTGLVAYYFGSSKGSSDKTKLLTTAKDSGG